LAICIEYSLAKYEGPRNFFYLVLDGNRGQLSLQSSLDNDMGTTGAVNGLICFYQGNDSSLYNIATHEIVKLPSSKYCGDFITYHFGFDPINNLYKILKVCPLYEKIDLENIFIRNLEYEILTLGVDSFWKNIDPPREEIESQGICINGVLHWMEIEVGPIIAFRLEDEKFQVIPPYSLDFVLPHFGITSLFQYGCFIDKYYWLRISHYKSEKWTKEQNFKIFKAVFGTNMDAVGMLPDGRLLIVSHGWTTSPMQFHVLDETNAALEEINVMRPSNCPRPSSSERIFYYEENISPLRFILGFSNSSGLVDNILC
jgi:F-box interacting protein